jgi:hypothetical protein
MRMKLVLQDLLDYRRQNINLWEINGVFDRYEYKNSTGNFYEHKASALSLS